MKRLIYLFMTIIFLMGMLPVKPAAANDCLDSIVVMNTNDSGTGSLRKAVEYVCPGGEITFDASLSGSTIDLSGQIQINKSMTIEGLGADQLAVSGSDLELNDEFTPSYDGGVFKLEALWS